MNKQEKETFVSDLRSALEASQIVIVFRQAGLTVAETMNLRSISRQANASVKISKNTLAKLAIQGLPCAVIQDQLSGPTALLYSTDPVAAAKALAQFAKGNQKIEIVCAAFGDKFLNADAVKQLATLPSLDELRGKLIGLIQAPATKIAGVVQAPAATLARVFSAYGRKTA